ncbi:somatostatin receptor type 4-like [Ostrea edulis]|uniref:somatostatin receptor type 4-like n=1 Tax=Ostrea edulis TaxID=37623 RepID=UPI0024AF2D42|nr:somatostatin receptor type 4-like [Ostrea edulis]
MYSLSTTTPPTLTENQPSENYPSENNYVNSTLMEGDSKQNSSEHTPIQFPVDISEESLLHDASFIIATILCIAGVLGNIATLVIIILKKKHKVPTYTGIFCLSLADTPSLVLRYFLNFRMIFAKIVSSEYIFAISFFTCFSSNFHVVIIAFLRYIYVSKPFYSRTLTCRRVLYLSAGVWMTSLVLSILYTVHLYLVEEKHMSLSQSYIVEVILQCLLFLGSIIPVIIFHILNIVQLRKGLSKFTVSFSKSMSTMLTTVVVIFVLANIPAIVVNALYFRNIHLSVEIRPIVYIPLMLNNSANPFVYFLFSETVRKRLQVFGYCSCFRK